MKGLFEFRLVLKLLALVFFSLCGLGVAATSTISPRVIEQVQQLPEAQQRAFAQQYGISIPNLTDSDEQGTPEDLVGKPGVEIEQFEALDRFIEEESEREDELEEETLPRFGDLIFDRDVSTFAPVDDMPVPSDYVLGPGDSLNVLMYGKEQQQYVLNVSRDGLVLFPQLGPLPVSGLTFDQTKEMIQARVSEQIVGTQVVVSIGALRSISVFMSGEVKAPGSYSVSGLATLTQVLYAAGGISSIGSLREIQVKRRGVTVATLDLYDVLLSGNTADDARLMSGDTVFVPVAGPTVAIDGEVRRPAFYEVVEGETLGDVIAMAGGVSAKGFLRSASIERRRAGAAVMDRLQVDLRDDNDLQISLLDGDFVSVSPIKGEIANQILVRGAVARPGGYQWKKGLRITDVIGDVDQDLLNDSDLEAALLVRRIGDDLKVEVLKVDLGAAIAAPGSASDLILKARDELLVFSVAYGDPDFRDGADLEEQTSDGESLIEANMTLGEYSDEEEKETRRSLVAAVVDRLEAQADTPSETRVVSITGDVRLPGVYPLLNSGSVSDLVALAGGFENSAFLQSAEVTRISFRPDGTASTRAIDVPLIEIIRGNATFELMPRDQVRVERIPNWSYGDTFTITGAAVFPGSYPIAPGEKLSSVLARAGGLDESAFPQGAVLIKVDVQEREREQLRKLLATVERDQIAKTQTREGQSGSFSSAELLNRTEVIERLLVEDIGGRVVINLSAILAGDPLADIQVQNGDSLYIPEYTNTISVIGEVRQPGTFRFEKDRSVADYLEYAAGATIRAMHKETYVVRADGSVDMLPRSRSLFRFRPSSARELYAGDTIVVPVNPDYQPVLAKYREITSVVFQSMASIFPLLTL